MPDDSEYPITGEDLRKTMQFGPAGGNIDALEFYAATACEIVDRVTGRDQDPDRHTLPNGKLPKVFRLAALATARLWWQQDHNGPRPVADPEGGVVGPPLGATLPRRVEGWLSHYPPPPGFGQPAEAVTP